MASLARNPLTVACLLLPVIALAYRPFDIPRNLFTSSMKDASLPEGTREINIETSDQNEGLGDLRSPRKLYRTRRAASSKSPPPSYVESDLPPETHETLYMNWPGDTIILLAKNKKGLQTSNVYLSTNFGRNWTLINTQLQRQDRSNAVIDQIYVSKLNPKLCILTDIIRKTIFITNNYKTFTRFGPLTWTASFIVFHPKINNNIMGYDKIQKMLYISTNGGSTFKLLQDKVRTFWWGVPGIDGDKVVFVDRIKSSGAKPTYTALKLTISNPVTSIPILDDIDEFELMQNYMFATQTVSGAKTKLMVSYKRGKFVETKFPVTESNRDYFVFDVIDEQVFVVINHHKNESNMYISNIGGEKFTISLPRVLYHNPFTDVSSPWLRTVVPYAFVDVHKVKSMRGVYIATQLTPGPVGRRHLLTQITYNKGGSWKRVRSPTRDVNNQPIYCFLPSCSLHLNLLYGSVYRISPSENLLSSTSAPGLVMALGVASTNLKIHPDMFLSTDGGLNWKRVLRGKHQYAFGDHGGVVVATFFRRYTNVLKYSVSGGESWQTLNFSPKNVLVQDIVTQDQEKLPIFLLYGTPSGRKKSWKIYQFNMTSALGPSCNSSNLMKWIPSDDRVGLDACILGKQEEYQIRNWTTPCYLGNDYKGAKFIKNCDCVRSDYECDFGFQRNASHPDCRPVPGEDLDNDLIPDKCDEGTTYKRSSGYRKIPGDTCVGGEERNYWPVDTPCPVKELAGLSVSVSPSSNPIALATNTPITLTASLTKGYLPNVNFVWHFGDESKQNRTMGKTVAHSFQKPGHFVVVLTASNTRSILVKRVEITVEEPLICTSCVSVTYSPADPTIAQPIAFITSLVNISREAAGHLTYKWKIEGNQIQQSWQPLFKHVFDKSKDYTITVEISNSISSVRKSVLVTVSTDLRPRQVKGVVLGPTSVLVSWKSPLEPSLLIAGYKVFSSMKRKSGFKECSPVPADKFDFLVQGLQPSTTYYFKVMAFTKSGDGPFSDITSGSVTNASAPGKPQHVRAYPLSSTSIRLEWKPPLNDYGRIQTYSIHWWSEGSQSTFLETSEGRTTRRHDFVKLMQDTLYSFEIFAKSSIGLSEPAGPVSARSNISKPIFAPRQFNQMSNNGTCSILVWDAPYLSSHKQRVFQAKGYKVFLKGDLKMITSEKRVRLCGLTPGNSYTVKVSAYSVAGDGPKASLVIKLISLRPTPPTNVQATAMTSRSIKLRWNAPLAMNGKLIKYAIYQRMPVAWENPVSAGVSTSYEVQNLEPYTKYEYVVVAINNEGQSPESAKATVMTHEELPLPPNFVTAELVKPESATILVRWSQPEKAYGKITGYKVSWGKTSVSDDKHVGNHKEIIGNKMTFTFSNLYSGTEYSFEVASKNGAGQSMSFSEIAKIYTQPAIEGTKRMQIEFQGKQDTADDNFSVNFVQALAEKADIDTIRIAALNVKAVVVEFEIMPPFKANAPSVDQAILSLNKSFSVASAKTVTGSVRVLRVYSAPTKAPTLPMKAVAGKQQGPLISKNPQSLALVIVLSCIGLLLVIGLILGVVFYYRKYKSLEKHYSNMSGIYRAQEDELNVIYPGDIVDEHNDRVLLGNDIKTKNKKKHKCEEKMPLGENDELAMV